MIKIIVTQLIVKQNNCLIIGNAIKINCELKDT